MVARVRPAPPRINHFFVVGANVNLKSIEHSHDYTTTIFNISIYSSIAKVEKGSSNFRLSMPHKQQIT